MTTHSGAPGSRNKYMYGLLQIIIVPCLGVCACALYVCKTIQDTGFYSSMGQNLFKKKTPRTFPICYTIDNNTTHKYISNIPSNTVSARLDWPFRVINTLYCNESLLESTHTHSHTKTRAHAHKSVVYLCI